MRHPLLQRLHFASGRPTVPICSSYTGVSHPQIVVDHPQVLNRTSPGFLSGETLIDLHASEVPDELPVLSVCGDPGGRLAFD